MLYDITTLEARHSVRNYTVEPVADNIRRHLQADITMANSHEAGINLQLRFDDPGPLEGFRRSYGMFRNASNYLAAVIDPTFGYAAERAAFHSQHFVMEALAYGLDSCFISGSFAPGHTDVQKEVYETLPFIVAFGHAAERTQTGVSALLTRAIHGRKTAPREFFAGTDAEYSRALELFPWLETGLRGMACAPSASNRREARIALTSRNGKYVLEAFSSKIYRESPLDLGIAKFNFMAPLPVEGEWEWGEHGAFTTF